MQFALKKSYYSESNKEISILKRIIDFLICNGIEEYTPCKQEMSSFYMNDLLLAPPSSTVREQQRTVKENSLENQSDLTHEYIYQLHKSRYGYYSEDKTVKRIATTTALMLEHILEQKSNQNFFCYNIVERGGEEMQEMEIALLNVTYTQARNFYYRLISYVMNKKIDLVEIPTYFSWAEAAVAFRLEDRKLKYGALGFVRDELLNLRNLENGKDMTSACIIGLPLNTLFKGEENES